MKGCKFLVVLLVFAAFQLNLLLTTLNYSAFCLCYPLLIQRKLPNS